MLVWPLFVIYPTCKVSDRQAPSYPSGACRSQHAFTLEGPFPLFALRLTRPSQRWMSFAPLPLAVMFNIGALMGWSDLAPGNGSLHYVLGEGTLSSTSSSLFLLMYSSGSPAAGRVPFDILLPLFFGCCCWTVTFETVYQHQDKADDVAIGLRSLAIFCGKATVAVCALTTLGFGGLIAWAFWLNGQGKWRTFAIRRVR